MLEGTMATDIKRIETRITLKRSWNGRKVESVWVVDEVLLDRKAADGTEYTINYGIHAVHERIIFDKGQLASSKKVKQAIDALSDKYPTAVKAIL